MSQTNLCPICHLPLKKKNLKGEVMPWKDFPFVKINFDVFILSCANCEDALLSSKEINEIDLALEKSIREKTSLLIRAIKEKTSFSQKIIAGKIGVTEVYLSDLSSKKKTPSFQAFNLIKVIANEPHAINQLNCFDGDCDNIKKVSDCDSVLNKFSFVAKHDAEQIIKGTEFIPLLGNNEGSVH